MNSLPCGIGSTILGSALILTSAVAAAQSEGNLPASRSRSLVVEREARLEELQSPGAITPFWDRGFAIQIETMESFSQHEINVSAFGTDARRVLQGSVWPEGASRVTLQQAVMAPDGVVVAAGSAIMKDRTRMNFVARLNAQGTTVQVVNTNPFVVGCLCVADDGTVWSFGDDPDRQERGEDFAMLRQFSFAKGLLDEDLPRSTFPRVMSPSSLVEVSYMGDPHGTYLRCGRDRIALFVGRTDEYIEVDPKTRHLRRFKVDTSPVGRSGVIGLAVVDGGPVVAALSEGGNPKGLTGLFELATDARTMAAHWVPVDGTVARLANECGADGPEGQFLRLWGSHKGELVVERSGRGRFTGHSSWEKLEPISAQEP